MGTGERPGRGVRSRWHRLRIDPRVQHRLRQRGPGVSEQERGADLRRPHDRAPERDMRDLRRQELVGRRQRREEPTSRTALSVLDALLDRPLRHPGRLPAGSRVVRQPGQDVERTGERERTAREHAELAADDRA